MNTFGTALGGFALGLSITLAAVVGGNLRLDDKQNKEISGLVERIRVLEIQLAEQNLRLCGVEQEVGTCQ